MGFKLIFEPLKAKIPLSQIFKKMKNLTFGPKKKAIKTTMTIHAKTFFSKFFQSVFVKNELFFSPTKN